jgi:hypothetical protein
VKYSFEDLSPEQFEQLIVFLCQQLLGIAVQGFATGPDGGRDAKFVGTAELHPSKAAPWVGTVIIQAKHTSGYNKSFSDPEFCSQAGTNSIIAKEVPRIRKLRQKKEVDHYMLFANRRLAGNAESTIRSFISNECGIPVGSVYLSGIEQLEVWLKTFPGVPRLAGIDPVDGPLIVSPDELAEVVEALVRGKNVSTQYREATTPRTSSRRRIGSITRRSHMLKPNANASSRTRLIFVRFWLCQKTILSGSVMRLPLRSFNSA